MGRILVVYYSRTGRTQQIAEAIAAQLNADIEPIRDGGRRLGFRGYLRSLLEAMQKRVIRISAPTKDPSAYDLTILGTPVWARNMCSPMRAYISAQRHRFKRIAVFCTQGGSGGTAVADKIAELCARRPAATLVLNEDEIKENQFSANLDRFAQSLSQAKAA